MLAKFKLNSREALISKALIGSNNSHDEFFLIKEYDNIKKEIKKFQDFKSVHQRKFSIFKRMLSYCLKCRKMQKVQIEKL